MAASSTPDRSGKQLRMLFPLQFLRDLGSYYRGGRDRDLYEFYDLESRLPIIVQIVQT
jgi:hypothetical protein